MVVGLAENKAIQPSLDVAWAELGNIGTDIWIHVLIKDSLVYLPLLYWGVTLINVTDSHHNLTFLMAN